MTSRIIVNNIQSDTGVSTVTFSSNISAPRIDATRIVGVSTLGVTTAYIGAINDGPLSGARNIIINGSMDINQRGWTGAAGTSINGSYTTDRFFIQYSHDGAVSAGQTSMNSTVGGNAFDDGFKNALFFRVNTADASLAAGQYQRIQQPIEGFNVQGIKKGTANALPMTLSFWVRSTTTGTYVVELEDVDNTRTVSQAYAINAANTWEKKVLTFPADTTGAFNNDNTSALAVSWWLASGSTYSSGTLNTSWAANTDANRAVGQVNLLASAGNNFFLTGVQLEVGSVATPFERRSYGQELALCQRYYVKFESPAVYSRFGMADCRTTTDADCIFSFPVQMRSTPILQTSGTPGHYAIYSRNTIFTITSGPIINTAGTTTLMANVNSTTSGLTAGSAGQLMANNTNAAFLGFSAEL